MFSVRMVKLVTLVFLLATYLPAQTASTTPAAAPQGEPTAAEAAEFVKRAEARMAELGEKSATAGWVRMNFITYDTAKLSAEADAELAAAVSELALASRRYEKLQLPADQARKLMLLKLALSAPAPSDPAELKELTQIAVKMDSEYGEGKYCPDANNKESCLDITALEKKMSESRDYVELLDMWKGWHAVGAPMRDDYVRFVELANKGAREMGFKDVGAMWRSNYDMTPEEFSDDVERLWKQMEPLYVSLHTYVRNQLIKKYGKDKFPENGMIPAHLLGNMWAQEWGHIYPLVSPFKETEGVNVTQLLQAKNTDALDMVRYGEGFFTSLGFQKLPETFWERSLFTKPRDREVVCHASAWQMDAKDDVRLKMCIQVRDEDFVTVHHELGHTYYQLAYNKQPFLFQGAPNDGFHEAVGDAIALSVTPEYLKEVGLLQTAPPTDGDLAFLLRGALDKVAFLPFGLMIDQWRWRVFSGEVTPENYNKAWWELRNKYQGVAAPEARGEQYFDPGAKYHIPGNTPYTRYFLARILQFQFHRSMCQAAGFKGPLHRCSVYNSKEAGAKLKAMLEMGSSQPWPDALEALTGQRQIDATAMLDYYAPLKKWLDEQNAGAKMGWTVPGQAPAASAAGKPAGKKKPKK